MGAIKALWREFPTKRVTVLGVLIAIGGIGGSTRHPFFPFLTHDFFPYLNSNQIGYYTGYLTSATFTGNFIGCLLWGKLSDIVGRRPILLSSATALLVGMVLVGFSFSFVWTVCVLFLEGLLNGTVVVAKTYLYEICPPEYHSLAFSLVWVPNNVALFVGPTLGGFLACPATRFQTFDIPIFRQFPYLLPCAVVGCIQFCILIVGCVYLTESRGKTPKDEYIDLTEVSAEDNGGKRHEASIMGILRDRLVLIPCALYAVYALASICTNYTLLPLLLVSDPGHGGYNFGPAEVSIVLTTIAVYGTVTKATLTPFIASKISYKTVFVTGLVLYAVGISLLPSMANISGLGAMTSREVSNQTAYSSDLIQNFTTAEGFSTASPQVMTESYTQTTAEMNATVERPLPGQCRLAKDKRETSQPEASDMLAWVWGPLLLVVLVMEQGRSFSFLASMVLVGNSGVQSNRGTINSIAQTMASLLKLLGPAVSANLFAWTNDNGLPWPLDHHLVFYVAAVLCLLMAVICASLPASINNPRVALDSPTASRGSDEGKD
ncbi:uncharacterized protein LOC144925145 [Branchiostoma floridae x Branchiostoma belcheri]